MSKFHITCQAGILIQKSIELGCGQGTAGDFGNMQHKPFPGQVVHAGFFNHPSDFFMVLLTDKKALHPDHGAAHKGIFVKSRHRKDYIPTAAGNGEGDCISDLNAKHGDHRGGNIDFSRRDFCGCSLIARQILSKKFVGVVPWIIGNQLAFAV